MSGQGLLSVRTQYDDHGPSVCSLCWVSDLSTMTTAHQPQYDDQGPPVCSLCWVSELSTMITAHQSVACVVCQTSAR
ncbi:hypothetical protein RRG08_007154 [Elysia crispata]|uniref:Uncharacterized protein n=1 Tax=Elysia crispata TaxID=231223 RepID=A0AAE1E909_9GAST|nr:hypothetical protein RRG08_007154 [Elysia crispata]